MRLNKKGFELAINVIVVLIIGLIALTVFLLWFLGAFSQAKNGMSPFTQLVNASGAVVQDLVNKLTGKSS